jgi:CCR4-NOT transcription complex subunit 6
VSNGGHSHIRELTDFSTGPDPPLDRTWIPLVEEASDSADSFTVFSWNILCDRAATANMYGYTPSEALSWQRRRDMIIDEMTGRNADIMCLQEIDIENYNEFFRPNLASEDYKGIFYPKSRAQTMAEKEAKVVDGCAIFYKNTKYILLDKQFIVFSREAIQRPDMKGEHDVYNRVMPRDHVAVVAFLENRQTGSRLIVANTHLTWEPWFSDIKIVQVAILMEHLAKLSEQYAKWPACKDKELFKFANEDSEDGVDEPRPEPGPSMKYDEATQIPLLVCGDFNSTRDSGVYDLITQGSLSNSHAELGDNNYGDFTRHGMSHPFSLKSAYSHIGELRFTNYTPDFRQTIDWVFYSTQSIQVTGVLGEVDTEYMRRVPGWPNHYFPSDHLPLMMEFSVKERKERKQVETDFGNSKSGSRS